jgi:hypothetical protein
MQKERGFRGARGRASLYQSALIPRRCAMVRIALTARLVQGHCARSARSPTRCGRQSTNSRDLPIRQGWVSLLFLKQFGAPEHLDYPGIPVSGFILYKGGCTPKGRRAEGAARYPSQKRSYRAPEPTIMSDPLPKVDINLNHPRPGYRWWVPGRDKVILGQAPLLRPPLCAPLGCTYPTRSGCGHLL